MCGIVAAAINGGAVDVLLDGLSRLEYRGYDSAGFALHNGNSLHRARALGRVAKLKALKKEDDETSGVGIAHTRWATHGVPSESNAHPHMSGDDIALVHNGIIENYAVLREELQRKGYEFTSQTDTEVVVHLIRDLMEPGVSLLQAVSDTVRRLEGAYALAVIATDSPDEIIAVRSGSPMVIGVSEEGYYLASDVAALLKQTKDFIFPEEGDLARLRPNSLEIFDANGMPVDRPIVRSKLSDDATDLGGYAHYMHKEIHEQPAALRHTLEGRLGVDHVLETAFGPKADYVFSKTKVVHIIACGTSYHAGLVASYWLERFANIPCRVEIASEYRYRHPAVPQNTLFVSLSQSGETADTIAALRLAKKLNYLSSLSICNVPESTLVRESDFALMTHAGQEIGVASTKAFTTQLAALLMLTAALTRVAQGDEAEMVKQLRQLPEMIQAVLSIEPQIKEAATIFDNVEHALFLGRGVQYPIAMEGALKLKEISYIHAEAYAAGELKHGPLALVDSDMPVVVVAPNNELLDKLRANMQEVRARGGRLVVFASSEAKMPEDEADQMFRIDGGGDFAEAILFTVPLQMLAYYVALRRGADIDKPRNLAKSVTVE